MKSRAIQKFSDTTTRIRAFYERNQKYAPVASFLAGFTWDSLTLTRIDLFLTNLVLFLYVLFAGFLIYLINMQQQDRWNPRWLVRFDDWYPLLLQFLFGGLFSSFVVFYFRSASLDRSWLFLMLLAGLLVGNEFIKNRLYNIRLQFAIYYLAVYSFFVFFIPVLVKSINAWVFLLSGFVSSALMAGLLYLLVKSLPDPSVLKIRRTAAMLGIIAFLYNLFYFTNIIPPVPLSLKEGGIYHNVQRSNGEYALTFEKGAWYEWFKDDDSNFYYQQGDTVYCFSAVFAPTALETKIWHNWQYFDEKSGEWVSTDRHAFPITGGRDGGYRGYTWKKNVQAGEWRVSVETDRGQLLGRISTEVIATEIKNGAPRGLKTIYY